MELIISEIVDNENKLVPVKLTNFDTLEKDIQIKMKEIAKLKFTEENLKSATEYRANLNKFKKAISDRRIAIHKDIEEKTGYNELDRQCKVLTGYVDEALTNVGDQIKAFEKIEKDYKLQQILSYWIEFSGDYAEVVNVDKLIKEEWLNKSYSMTNIKTELTHIINKIPTDLKIIENKINNETICNQVKTFYFDNLSNVGILGLAIQKGDELSEQSKKVENLEKTTENKVTLTNSSQNSTDSKVISFDFRIWATKEQLLELKEYLIKNNIKFGSVK